MTETEKNHSFQRVQLMKQAAVIRQNNGMNRHDALVTAHRIGALIRQMHHGNVCFRYTKQDGTIRHATDMLGETSPMIPLAIKIPMGPRITSALATLYTDRKSTRLNSSHTQKSRMPSSA